ncbi:mechanosensitive ion channel family protein [uncultured Prevotella sp.]|uniref:mechanosensitive ion channel family protein n=1 Tax=uncultured Prevotella sp. TaxID=159272 RepID=UPI0025FBE57B|nr:mechanosensitive ion channel family protein [uncultured Prevotella sp.]
MTRKAIGRIVCLIIMLTLSVSAGAVLKEKNLKSTLSVLCAELETAFNEQRQNMARYNIYNQAQHKQMISLMQRSDQVALMLYSQKQDFTFDMTYACHEATEMYREFTQRSVPYNIIMTRMSSEIKRYDYLIETLQNIPPSLGRKPAKDGKDAPKQQKYVTGKDGKQMPLPFMLDKVGQANRNACLIYAKTLRGNLVKMRASVEKDSQHYKRMAEKLKKVNDYALLRYNDIQHNIFVNGDQNYLEIITSMPTAYHNAKADVNEKYNTEKVRTANGERQVYSQWRGPIVMGLSIFVIIYVLLAALLSNVFVRWLVPKRFRTENFMKKKVCLILFVAMFIFAVSVMIARMFMYHNFFLMASKLLIEYAWLLCAIFFSLLVRLPGDQIKSGFRIYTPIMLMSFIVITFRIIFIPNNLVSLIFPPILLVFTLWQWNVITRHNDNIPKSDIFYTWVSLVIMAFSTASALYGYVLLSVQLLIWWMFQLSCIQTITCVYDFLDAYERRWLSKKIHTEKETAKVKRGALMSIITKNHEKHINVTWFYDFVCMALLPVLSVFSILVSIWWAADVFDLTETVWKVFMFNFLNIPGVVQLSIGKLVMVASQFFVFRYLNYLIKALYHKYHKSRVVVNGKPNFTLANNVIAICCWGMYAIISVKMLKIPSTAVSVISAGLATGVGFAMKDLLENFFYGISLMTGRVRVGDYIECDGIRGKVDSITYQSTQVLTADGCVIAFLNSSLFSKNFKNITRNHSYEMVKIPVGIAYGSNVDEVRKMLIKAVMDLEEKSADGRDIIDLDKPVSVVFDDFGDNSVNLFVTYWVLVEEKFGKTGQIKEAIYNTLNAHNIEIPFPQRDIHIIESK